MNTDQYIIDNYPDMTACELSDATGKSVPYIYALAYKMGLRKSEAFKQSGKNGRFKNGEKGLNTRFKKGCQSWNKGVKGFMPANKTSFKKGAIPHNALPVGAETIYTDTKGKQYLKVKIEGARQLVFKHVYIWMQAHGDIPDGHVVVFRDGNTMNCVIDNLECITRKTLMLRNSIMRYPPVLRDTIRLVHKVNRKIKQHEEQN